MADKKYKPPYKHNKKEFSYLGVIFEVNKETNMIKICHIPYCGMDAETALRLSFWLDKRAKELK